jgi:hypothetical protein
MAVTEPSQNPISDGLAILISRHAWRKTFGPNSSGNLAIFPGMRVPPLSGLSAPVFDSDDGHIKFASRSPFVFVWKNTKVFTSGHSRCPNDLIEFSVTFSAIVSRRDSKGIRVELFHLVVN